MTIGAELTLQIARLVQMRPDANRSPTGWSFWPHGGSATWAEARAMLASMPKPVLVAPLAEPGHLAVFPVEQFPEPMRGVLNGQLANQVEVFAGMHARLQLPAGAALRFQPAVPECVLSVTEFMQWARDYAVDAGVSLARSSDGVEGRILVRPPGGGRAPLGA